MKRILAMLSVALMLVLSGCGNNANHNNPSNNNQTGSEMNHSTSSEIPRGLKEAKNPTFKMGNQAIIKADHMVGMNGAGATIVGAYDTTAYAVSYTPTSGGERVKNHKWVIQEEIKNAGEKPYQPGTKVVLQADHMNGMNGATAIIDSAEQTTVYMVDYIPTTGGEPVKNHKWVIQSELSTK